MRYNIGIDIDGVMTTPYYWLACFNKIFNKNVTEEQCTQYSLLATFGVTEEEWNAKTSSTLKEYLDSADIRDDVVKNLNIIKKEHNCHFITARNNTDYVRGRTEEYLKENQQIDIPLHMLSSHHKADKAKELAIDIFIEDCGENAMELANNDIKVFLLDTNYNKSFSHENIFRVYNWEQIRLILEIIQE